MLRNWCVFSKLLHTVGNIAESKTAFIQRIARTNCFDFLRLDDDCLIILLKKKKKV